MRSASKPHMSQRDGVVLKSHFSHLMRIACSISILVGTVTVALVGGVVDGYGFELFIVSVAAPVFISIVCAAAANTKTMTFIDDELIFKAGSKYYSIYADELQGYCFKQFRFVLNRDDKFKRGVRNFYYGKVVLYIDGKQYFVKCGSLFEAEACLKSFVEGKSMRARSYEYYELGRITREKKRFAFRIKLLCLGWIAVGAVTELLNISASSLPNIFSETVLSATIAAYLSAYLISLIKSTVSPNLPNLDGHIYFRQYGPVKSDCKEKFEEKPIRPLRRDQKSDNENDGFYE